MKKYVQVYKWLCMVLSLIVVLSGCSSKETSVQSDYNFVLGFSQLGNESGWRLGNTESIKNAALSYDVDLIYLNAEQKYENQVAHIRRLIANQVDIIAIAPIITSGWDNVLKEAKEANIPVIMTDRSIETKDDSLYVTFIGSDFKKEGVRAGEFLLEYYNKYPTNKETIKIIELRGTENSTPALGRSEGFIEVIKDSKFNIVYSVSGDFMNSRGKEIMADVLANKMEFDVIYSHNDAMTYGVIEELEAHGIQPGVDVVIISVDGEQKSIDLLKEKKINCVVECTPIIGEKLMEVSQAIIEGEILPKTIYSEETVFTMWDDLTNLSPRGY